MKSGSKLFILFILFIASLSFSCARSTKTSSNTHLVSDSLSIKYATGFAVYYHGDYKEVIVYNPWEKESVYARYYLTGSPDIPTPNNGTKVLIPLQTIALTSVTPLEFLKLIGQTKSINGICSPELVYNQEVQNRIQANEITNLGDGFNLNIEQTLTLHPQALMTSGYNQNDPNVLRISQAGIPVLYNNEWMETSLLARAEWIKFVSTFYNKETIADSIFTSVEQNYNAIKESVRNVGKKVKVMSGVNFRGTWYMPGGESFMGKLFEDAGADYFYADDKSSGSLPLQIETVIKNFAESDVWLNCNYDSREELLNADSKHALFRPVLLNEVYNFNKRKLPSGANDFWESAIARPDILLSDVIAILHPAILPGYELVYAEKLK